MQLANFKPPQDGFETASERFIMFASRCAGGVTLAIFLALGSLGVQAQEDPADLAFWQSIGNSTNPREYKAYLQAFPNGRFKAIAEQRALNSGSQPNSDPPVASVTTAPSDFSQPKISVDPPNGHVGQAFVFGCVNFPELKNNFADKLVVVHAGTPVMNPMLAVEQTKIFWSDSAYRCPYFNNTIPKVGPFAPGLYEVRYMSTLYTDDHSYQMKAMTAFSVR